MQKSFNDPPRVALFPDTYREANGVATLSRQLADFAYARNLPMLVVHGGNQNSFTQHGSVDTLELKRGPASFPVDTSLYCDPFLTRHKQGIIDRLKVFKPDLLHVTGPGDVGLMGLWVAHILRIPLVASWHTNLHEYLSRRLNRSFHLVPKGMRFAALTALEHQTMRGLVRFYRTASFVLAPNQTFVDLLCARTGRPAFLMPHGVDLAGYGPAPDCNGTGRQPFCIGYVGRLTPEKNVRLFQELDGTLIEAGERDYKFLVVGEGSQGNWLRKHLRQVEMPGVLRGDALAAAYGRMDVFVFPSRTDTFGLVILEAMASGVPVIVTPETGLRIGIVHGVSGMLSEDFAADVRLLMHDRDLRRAMGAAARQFATNMSWDAAFEQLYRNYRTGLKAEDNRRALRERSQALSL